MSNQSPEKPETPATRERPAKGRIFLGVAVLLVVAFLAGFLPQYLKGMGLASELRAARQENHLAEIRDLAGLLYLQASRKDYGLAAATSTRFFTRAREIVDQTPDSGRRKLLEDLLSQRDQITAELAKGEPGVLPELQTLYVQTRQATGVLSGTPPPE